MTNNTDTPKNSAPPSSRTPSTLFSAFWWIQGIVTGRHGEIHPARKSRVFRYVQTWTWGRWRGIREEYPEIPASFRPATEAKIIAFYDPYMLCEDCGKAIIETDLVLDGDGIRMHRKCAIESCGYIEPNR
jgi:hypothetical protein